MYSRTKHINKYTVGNRSQVSHYKRAANTIIRKDRQKLCRGVDLNAKLSELITGMCVCIHTHTHPGLISFRMDWLDLLEVQGTRKSLLQHHSSKASILRCSAFFTVQLSHPYMTTGKTIALTRWTFVGKVMSLLLNMLSRLVITFLPRSKHVLISWLQSK